MLGDLGPSGLWKWEIDEVQVGPHTFPPHTFSPPPPLLYAYSFMDSLYPFMDSLYPFMRGKSSYMNESSMRVNNTFRQIIDCFWRKHCRDSPRQTSSVVFQMFLRFFFSLTRSLIDRCQIVTDACKNNVSKFVWKPFKL